MQIRNSALNTFILNKKRYLKHFDRFELQRSLSCIDSSFIKILEQIDTLVERVTIIVTLIFTPKNIDSKEKI